MLCSKSQIYCGLKKPPEGSPDYSIPIFNPDEFNGPKVQFVKLDNLLQRKFFNLSPPILLRELHFTSKTAKEIKCPPSFISYSTTIYKEKKSTRSNFIFKFV